MHFNASQAAEPGQPVHVDERHVAQQHETTRLQQVRRGRTRCRCCTAIPHRLFHVTFHLFPLYPLLIDRLSTLLLSSVIWRRSRSEKGTLFYSVFFFLSVWALLSSFCTHFVLFFRFFLFCYVCRIDRGGFVRAVVAGTCRSRGDTAR